LIQLYIFNLCSQKIFTILRASHPTFQPAEPTGNLAYYMTNRDGQH